MHQEAYETEDRKTREEKKKKKRWRSGRLLKERERKGKERK